MKKWDKILIIIAIVICAISILFLQGGKKLDGNSNIVIKVENKVVKTIPLKIDSKNEIFEFRFNDKIGYVEVKDGAVRMLEMNKKICPEGICSETGWINKSYQTIVCLPNKIVVSFAQSISSSVDDISF